MRKALLLIAFLLGGAIGGILMPAKWRARLSQPLVVTLGNIKLVAAIVILRVLPKNPYGESRVWSRESVLSNVEGMLHSEDSVQHDIISAFI